jgi:hypothetical protein
LPKMIAASEVGKTSDGIPVYLVKDQYGANGIGVALYRLGHTRRTSTLPHGVAVIDREREEIREVNRYIQRHLPLAEGADAVNRIAHWSARQTALQRYKRIVREINKRKR